MAKYPAVLQVRNGSSRLKNKAMLKILKNPVLFYVIERIQSVRSISKLIVATSKAANDDSIEQYCIKHKIKCFRGSQENVLERIYKSIEFLEDDYFVKFWGDSILIDPYVCQNIIIQFEKKFQGFDYISNNHPSTYPEGMQIEIIKIKALETVYKAADLIPEDKEHVTTYLWRNTKKYKIGNVIYKENIHDQYRFVLDYPEDLEQLRKIIESLYLTNPLFSMEDAMKFLDLHPEVKAINQMKYETEQEYNARVYGRKKESP